MDPTPSLLEGFKSSYHLHPLPHPTASSGPSLTLLQKTSVHLTSGFISIQLVIFLLHKRIESKPKMYMTEALNRLLKDPVWGF